METTAVRDNPAKSRFELEIEEGHLGVVTYELAEEIIAFIHTIVPEAYEGRGLGSTLARAALDSARERKLGVVPRCEFIQAYITRHPEYEALVVEDFGG